MVSDVIITERAYQMLDEYVDYLVYVKMNSQAAGNLVDDFEETQAELFYVAESLEYCRDEDLKAYGYRIIFFKHLKYLFLYRVEDNRAIIDAMYHQLQDYENTFKTDELKL